MGLIEKYLFIKFYRKELLEVLNQWLKDLVDTSKKRKEEIIISIRKNWWKFIKRNLTNVLFSIALILVFLFFEDSLTTKTADFFVKSSDIKGSGLFTSLVLIAFIIGCYLFRRKKKFFAIDFLLIFIYIKYRFFPEYTPKIDSINMDLWTINLSFIHPYYITLILWFYLFIFLKWLFHYENINKYKTGYLYLDLPLKTLAKLNNTTLIDEDKYARERFASEIVTSIEIMKPFKAFSIGISGEWGSGKSSLFDLIKEKLEINKKIEVLEFSPWYSSKSETLILDFFRMLENNFQGDRILLENLKSYAVGLSSIEDSYFKSGILKSIFDNKENLKEKYSKIAEILQHQKKLFVIMIDDLDRLDKKEIISVLKLIRIIADFPNIVYLAAYDRKHIDAAIKSELTDYMPEKFVDKIFNMEFIIPEPSPDKIVDQLKYYLLLSLKTLRIDINERELSGFLKRTKTAYFIKNQRDVKRFTNNFIISFKPIKDDGIDRESFLLLQLINYKYPAVYKSVYDKEKELFDYIYKTKTDKGLNAQVDLSSILDITDENSKIINYIFNKNCEYTISSKFNFHKYFSLTLFGTKIKGSEVEEILKLDIAEIEEKMGDYYKIDLTLLIGLLHEKLHIITSRGTKDLTKYLQTLYFVYKKIITELGDSTITLNEDKRDVLNENLNQLSETTWNLLTNVTFKDRYIIFQEVFGRDGINIDTVFSLLKNRNLETFKEINIDSSKETIFKTSPQHRTLLRDVQAYEAAPIEAWKASDKLLEHSKWLIANRSVSKDEVISGGTYVFEYKLDLEIAPLFLESGEIQVLVDKECEVKVNSKPAGNCKGFENIATIDIKPFLQLGSNLIRFEVKNDPLPEAEISKTALMQNSMNYVDSINSYGLKYLISIK